MRIRVVDVLDLLAAGLSHAEIVEELPDLELDDIKAALAFASRSDVRRGLRSHEMTDIFIAEALHLDPPRAL